MTGSRNTIAKRILIALVVVVAMLVTATVWYVNDFYHADDVALVAVAPAHCGYVALFSMGWSVVVLIVEIVLAIWVGTIIME